MTDSTPIYNVKAVMHEVGLSAATLRAWEGRYGLPKPQRTAGGHRLYSRQDIEMLKWLIDKQKEGLSISSAVELWKTTTHGSGSAPAHVLTPATEKLSGEAVLDELRNAWVEACSNFDGRSADQILDQAFAITAPETVCLELLQKGLAEIGNRWYSGNITVQQEHFASGIGMRRINSLLAAAAPPTRTGRLLVACPPGEQHDFILLVATYLLRRNGWDVVYLGSNVPMAHLDITVRSIRPLLLITAAQTINSAAALRLLSEAVSLRGTPLAYGGGIFDLIPSLTRRISGHYLGSQLGLIPVEVERLVKSIPPILAALPVPINHTQALVRFTQNEANISQEVFSSMVGGPIDPELVNLANSELGRMISSALTLGDINLLDYTTEWLSGLLNNYGFPRSLVVKYYSAYQQAVERYLAGGSLIADWLGKQTQGSRVKQGSRE